MKKFIKELFEDFGEVVLEGMLTSIILILSGLLIFLLYFLGESLLITFNQWNIQVLWVIIIIISAIVIFFILGGIGRAFSLLFDKFQEKDTKGENDEEIMEFMLDNKCDLDTFVGNAKSCVYHGDEKAIRSLVTGEFSANDIYAKGQWMYPAGAFHGVEGEPC